MLEPALTLIRGQVGWREDIKQLIIIPVSLLFVQACGDPGLASPLPPLAPMNCRHGQAVA